MVASSRLIAVTAKRTIGHHLGGHTTHKGKSAHVAGDPIRQRLGPGCLGKGEVGSTEGGDKQLRSAHLAGLGVDHVNRGSGIVDKQPLACGMALAQHRLYP